MSNINVSPTKGFFIHMLTRDIPLEKAILDLLDNSVDSALKVVQTEQDKKFKIDLNLDKNKFQIRDNCGGISLKDANEYAFKFGRPEDVDPQSNSVGRFGIGMKRALFKLGSEFSIESKSNRDHFIITVDANQWIKDNENWNFTYYDFGDGHDDLFENPSQDGVIINVTKLHPDISILFNQIVFQNSLLNEVRSAISYRLHGKIEVTLNKIKVNAAELHLCSSESIIPYRKFNETVESDKDKVSFEIIASIGSANPNEAGWYLFCNERLVLAADRTKVTGWRESRDDIEDIVKFHNQYAMFRGAVFFNANNPDKLPMTTTKMGIDVNHQLYIKAQEYMRTALRQIADYLRDIKDKDIRDTIIKDSGTKEVSELRLFEPIEISFKGPIVSVTDSRIQSNISYSRRKEMVEKVKDFLGVSTNREVGEGTFDYFFKVNELENE